MDKLLKLCRFPAQGQVIVHFIKRINPTFNHTLLLLQALDVAYRASHSPRFHTILHTILGNRLFSTAWQPDLIGDTCIQAQSEGLLFTTASL